MLKFSRAIKLRDLQSSDPCCQLLQAAIDEELSGSVQALHLEKGACRKRTFVQTKNALNLNQHTCESENASENQTHRIEKRHIGIFKAMVME